MRSACAGGQRGSKTLYQRTHRKGTGSQHGLKPSSPAHAGQVLAASAGQLRPCGQSSAPLAVWTSRGLSKCYAALAVACSINNTRPPPAAPVKVGGSGVAALHMALL